MIVFTKFREDRKFEVLMVVFRIRCDNRPITKHGENMPARGDTRPQRRVLGSHNIIALDFGLTKSCTYLYMKQCPIKQDLCLDYISHHRSMITVVFYVQVI
uniref:Uncharacterized protein n=1 Tax=Aplanochytrium stocchinoi TaxID=215587 RepID=A0A7S3PJS6_9STRA|mmetsp:Transcript_7429/g.8977  ORF Transcript_7429/g.8977 Transcript_7429/m.8977 type:complete len:101 (+) Transcript_7429:38-340(+)